jgi:tetratricopeptide (TPR) repeat protein
LIGGLLSGLGVGIFVYAAVRKFQASRCQLPPILWSALAGMLAFSVSSMVSSFSLRAIQNGIAFFLMTAIAVYQIDKGRRSLRSNRRFRGSMAFGGLACGLMMTAFAASKAMGEYYASRAEAEADPIAASEIYRSSIAVDPDNAAVYYYLSARQGNAGQFDKAARSLREGIDRGIGVSITYSLLAEYELQAGDPDSSEKTLREALHIFPNSVFLRVRFGTFLRDVRHDTPAAAEEFARATSINPRQAKGWQELITDGSVATFYSARSDETIAPPADLHPANAVLHYLDK